MAVSFRGVIFDLFGTLVPDFPRTQHERCVGAMARVLRVDADELHSQMGTTWPMRVRGDFVSIEDNLCYMLNAMGRAVEPDSVAEAAALRLAFTEQALHPKPDALPTLRTLRRGGVRIGLISDCSPDVPAVWPRSALCRHIDAPIFSCNVHYAKPDPRIYADALAALDLQPVACAYVGDGSSRELTGARQCGLYAVLVAGPTTDSYDTEKEDVRLWTGPRVSDLRELALLLAEGNIEA